MTFLAVLLWTIVAVIADTVHLGCDVATVWVAGLAFAVYYEMGIGADTVFAVPVGINSTII